MRLLFVATTPPAPPHDGVARKTYGLLRALAPKTEIHLVAYCDPDTPPTSEDLVAAIPGLASCTVVHRGRAARRLTPGALHRARYPAAALPAAVRELEVDCLHLDTFPLLHLAELAGSGGVTVWSLNDAYSRVMVRRVAGAPDAMRRAALRYWTHAVGRAEARGGRRFDFVDVVSRHDFDHLRAAGVKGARLLPLGRTVLRRVALHEGPATVGLMAPLAGGASGDIAHFLTRAWPLVRHAQPAAELLIVGRAAGADPHLQRLLRESPGVRHLERVAAVEDFLGAVDVALILKDHPLGLSNKALEAMSGGVPAVGMRQLATLPPPQGPVAGFAVCSTHRELAETLAAVLTDAGRRAAMRAAALAYMEDWPTWDQVAAQYLQGIEAALPSASR